MTHIEPPRRRPFELPDELLTGGLNLAAGMPLSTTARSAT
jgi:hypothetical protein